MYTKISYYMMTVINIACLLLYVAGAIGTYVQYFILCRKVSPDLWYFAIENKLKLTGAKRRRSSVLSAKTEWRFWRMLLGRGREGKGEAWKTTKKLFSKRKLFRYVRRFNWVQRRSLLACVYDSWFNSAKRIPNILPYTVFIDITSQCNLRCEGCFSSDLKRANEMNFDTLQKVIPVLKSGGIKAIVLTGGEPTLYDKLMNLVTENRDIIFFVFTNGQKPLWSYKEFVRKLGNMIFIFSIDGDKALHEKRRGSGTYQPILDNMQYLKKHRIGFGVSVTVSKKNINELPAKIRELKKYKPAFTLFFRFNSKDRALSVSDKDYDKFCKETTELPYSLVVHLPYYETWSKISGCIAGKYIFHIRSDFTISNCPYVRHATEKPITGMTAEEIAELLATQTMRCAHSVKAPVNERKTK